MGAGWFGMFIDCPDNPWTYKISYSISRSVLFDVLDPMYLTLTRVRLIKVQKYNHNWCDKRKIRIIWYVKHNSIYILLKERGIFCLLFGQKLRFFSNFRPCMGQVNMLQLSWNFLEIILPIDLRPLRKSKIDFFYQPSNQVF